MQFKSWTVKGTAILPGFNKERIIFKFKPYEDSEVIQDLVNNYNLTLSSKGYIYFTLDETLYKECISMGAGMVDDIVWVQLRLPDITKVMFYLKPEVPGKSTYPPAAAKLFFHVWNQKF